jgi:CheY-like chemotaxis protein
VELAQYLRAQYPNLPIILLSSLGDTSFNKSSELFVSVVTKPIRQQTLSVHILNALRKQGKNISHVQTELTGKDLTEAFAKKHPLNILLAEDDIYNQMVAVQVFENMGYKIEVANNGRIAVEYANKNYYDIILMDVQMPEMDGFEATKNIRQNMATQPIIVAMTANAMDGDRNVCLQAGMDDYISKPINLDELAAKLEKWSGYIFNQAS